MLSFCFRLLEGDGLKDGLDAGDIRRGSSEQNVPTSEDVSHASTELTTELYRSVSGVWGLGSVAVACDIGVITLKGLLGRTESLRLVGMMGCCLP